MPDGNYHFQYQINPQTIDRVDCAVVTADGLNVPIDSKFYAGQYQQYQNASKDSDRKVVLRDLKAAILAVQNLFLKNTFSKFNLKLCSSLYCFRKINRLSR